MKTHLSPAIVKGKASSPLPLQAQERTEKTGARLAQAQVFETLRSGRWTQELG